ncbi:hypothetical protein KUCAC02_037684 [Chaenocephalus aceratus]|nr:hypothetical protein KUCAC02_037684 [Chaenocephalus aceratus]
MIIIVEWFQSRARQEDPEQARLKQKAKEVRSITCFLSAERWLSNMLFTCLTPPPQVVSGPGSSPGSSSSRQQLRQRITRVNLRDFIFCLETDRITARSLTLYKALLK